MAAGADEKASGEGKVWTRLYEFPLRVQKSEEHEVPWSCNSGVTWVETPEMAPKVRVDSLLSLDLYYRSGHDTALLSFLFSPTYLAMTKCTYTLSQPNLMTYDKFMEMVLQKFSDEDTKCTPTPTADNPHLYRVEGAKYPPLSVDFRSIYARENQPYIVKELDAEAFLSLFAGDQSGGSVYAEVKQAIDEPQLFLLQRVLGLDGQEGLTVKPQFCWPHEEPIYNHFLAGVSFNPDGLTPREVAQRYWSAYEANYGGYSQWYNERHRNREDVQIQDYLDFLTQSSPQALLNQGAAAGSAGGVAAAAAPAPVSSLTVLESLTAAATVPAPAPAPGSA